MSKVVALMSMSLDGFVADGNDGVGRVFDWYFNSGSVEFETGGSDPMTFKVSAASAEYLRGIWSEMGAVLTGRRTFDVAHGWGGNHSWGPAFVLTHHTPEGNLGTHVSRGAQQYEFRDVALKPERMRRGERLGAVWNPLLRNCCAVRRDGSVCVRGARS